MYRSLHDLTDNDRRGENTFGFLEIMSDGSLQAIEQEVPQATDPTLLTEFWSADEQFQSLGMLGLVRHFVTLAISSMRAAPFTALLTMITMSIALFLCGIFLLLFENISDLLVNSQSEVTVSVFLQEDVDDEVRAQLTSELRGITGVAEVRYRSKAQALTTFAEMLGEQSYIAAGLEDSNPLPASLELSLLPEVVQSAEVWTQLEELAERSVVDQVHFNRDLAGYLSELARAFHIVGVALVSLVLIITCFIISNTVRLALYSHREEIEIMRLVGGTDQFICAPYLVEGVLQGLLGSVVAMVLILTFKVGLEEALLQLPFLASVGNVRIELSGMLLALLILTGVGVGIIGRYAAVRRFLVR